MADWIYSSGNCSIARTLAVVGDRWTLLIMREAFFGVRRFGEFRSRLGIASNLLASRLDALVGNGLLRRIPYREQGERPRHEYELTERGLELTPILAALRQWGDRYLADPAGPSLVVRHRTGLGEPACDQPVHVTLECAAGHHDLRHDELQRIPGPGARLDD